MGFTCKRDQPVTRALLEMSDEHTTHGLLNAPMLLYQILQSQHTFFSLYGIYHLFDNLSSEMAGLGSLALALLLGEGFTEMSQGFLPFLDLKESCLSHIVTRRRRISERWGRNRLKQWHHGSEKAAQRSKWKPAP